MDRDVRNALIACGASVLATLALFALRMKAPAPVAPPAPASAAAAAPRVAPAVVLKDAPDVAMSQFALQQWSGAMAGEETTADAEDAGIEEPPPARTRPFQR